ncbi:hypothetical protein HYH02_009134 [Chlamydomonas schloesseri]|uniref:Protein kinase domain-containing protein n=1 Tax=Chlamydomonas schloesseri TaxID=2026947 RepID=A0A835WBA2_9CHLO|nr:hypothetical protein HYH02_009134 [Chlamydomonas schloesseri]|eukprot:KAG2444196.1 hypothetical protein HYH02_009134 [Chlamydomonas schloesseri]
MPILRFNVTRAVKLGPRVRFTIVNVAVHSPHKDTLARAPRVWLFETSDPGSGASLSLESGVYFAESCNPPQVRLQNLAELIAQLTAAQKAGLLPADEPPQFSVGDQAGCANTSLAYPTEPMLQRCWPGVDLYAYFVFPGQELNEAGQQLPLSSPAYGDGTGRGSSNGSVTAGIIVGCAVGGSVAVGILVGLLMWALHWRRRRRGSSVDASSSKAAACNGSQTGGRGSSSSFAATSAGGKSPAAGALALAASSSAGEADADMIMVGIGADADEAAAAAKASASNSSATATPASSQRHLPVAPLYGQELVLANSPFRQDFNIIGVAVAAAAGSSSSTCAAAAAAPAAAAAATDGGGADVIVAAPRGSLQGTEGSQQPAEVQISSAFHGSMSCSSAQPPAADAAASRAASSSACMRPLAQQQQQLTTLSTVSRVVERTSAAAAGELSPQLQQCSSRQMLQARRDSDGAIEASSAMTATPAAAAVAAGAADVLELLPVVRGRGGFGRVVEGVYRGERVAVKLLLGSAAEGAAGSTQARIDAYVQEVEVMGRCTHPNIVRLLAACVDPRQPCLVMELCEMSLEALIFKRGRQAGAPPSPLPLLQVFSIGIDICNALSYLHPTVLHRDLKPANVLINGVDSGTLVAKVADFGLARFRAMTMPTKQPEAGTTAYMAPECFDVRNAVVTHHADLYSLGVLLWTMLTGQEPWQGYSLVAIAYMVCVNGTRLPLGGLLPPRCPDRLRRLISALWDPDPLRRPAAVEVGKELALIQQKLFLHQTHLQQLQQQQQQLQQQHLS